MVFNKLYSNTLVICLFATLLNSTIAAITGQITLTNAEIQATSVNYTFQLNFQAATNPATVKIVMRFPQDYTASFTT